jgi:AraC family transcriptional activator of pyochelin receptor
VSPDQIEPMFGADAVAVQNRKAFDARIWEREPVITSLGWQMLGCSLTTNARRLYLSGKALELLSVMAEGSTAAAPMVASGRPREIQQIHDARTRLLADLQNPPSVPELAQAVGLNARRLGELFKVHFGTTVYAFLKAARFDRARLLLEAGGLSVAQVAYQYGYQPAHFSTEFKRRFGVPPTALTRRSGH